MVRLLSLALVPALVACRPAEGVPPVGPLPMEGFWAHWGDGRAEVNGYALTQPRYGEDRRGEAVLIFVTEDFDASRRQVTVLFADISGYTALTSRLDAEDTHALLNRYFETVDAVVRDFGGHIDKHIGDAVMAVFGAPIALDRRTGDVQGRAGGS